MATVYAVAMALERNPGAGEAAVAKRASRLMSHGYRWINYHGMEEATEREHIERAVEIITRDLRPAPGRVVHRAARA